MLCNNYWTLNIGNIAMSNEQNSFSLKSHPTIPSETRSIGPPQTLIAQGLFSSGVGGQVSGGKGKNNNISVVSSGDKMRRDGKNNDLEEMSSPVTQRSGNDGKNSIGFGVFETFAYQILRNCHNPDIFQN